MATEGWNWRSPASAVPSSVWGSFPSHRGDKLREVKGLAEGCTAGCGGSGAPRSVNLGESSRGPGSGPSTQLADLGLFPPNIQEYWAGPVGLPASLCSVHPRGLPSPPSSASARSWVPQLPFLSPRSPLPSCTGSAPLRLGLQAFPPLNQQPMQVTHDSGGDKREALWEALAASLLQPPRPKDDQPVSIPFLSYPG